MKPDEIAKRLDLLRKEWEELAPAAKYSIIFSIVCIILIWIDKSLDLAFFESISNNTFSLTLSNLYFLLVNISVFLIFLILVLERGYINLKIIYYKWKHPLGKLNKDFYIVSFRGRVCLLDNVKKEVKWIKSWQTALDLDFIGEWTNIDIDITLPSKLVDVSFMTKDGVEINLKDFKYTGGVHTQGTPGT